MALLNDIKRMQAEGRADSEIIEILKRQGISPREITEALTQSKIKEAVAGEGEAAPIAGYEASAAPLAETPAVAPAGEGEYVPSQPIPTAQPQPAAEAYPAQPAYPQAMPEQYPQYAPQYPAQPAYPQAMPEQYPQYQPAGISPDTITEIAEQVVSEKLSPMRDEIKKTIDMKTTFEAKMETLDERLKRIEKIIDRLNLSIMQKVGDYMTNIEDIKKELQETQKSFKAISTPARLPEIKHEKTRKPVQKQQAEQE